MYNIRGQQALSLSLRVSSETQLGPSSMKENKTQKEKNERHIHVQIERLSFPPCIPSTGAVVSSLEQRPFPAGRLISQFDNKITTNGREKEREKKEEGRPGAGLCK